MELILVSRTESLDEEQEEDGVEEGTKMADSRDVIG